jgi:hypothetical protein
LKRNKEIRLFVFRQFFNEAFEPFSAMVQVKNNQSVYSRMIDVVNGHTQNLKTTIEK